MHSRWFNVSKRGTLGRVHQSDYNCNAGENLDPSVHAISALARLVCASNSRIVSSNRKLHNVIPTLSKVQGVPGVSAWGYQHYMSKVSLVSPCTLQINKHCISISSLIVCYLLDVLVIVTYKCSAVYSQNLEYLWFIEYLKVAYYQWSNKKKVFASMFLSLS